MAHLFDPRRSVRPEGDERFHVSLAEAWGVGALVQLESDVLEPADRSPLQRTAEVVARLVEVARLTVQLSTPQWAGWRS